MDRRQRKTREAIFGAFSSLLSKKHYNQITVGEIIEKADVGRATFYSHFETKDYLLKELCEELFCHIFDSSFDGGREHKHIFDCDAPTSAVLHLLKHLEKNDNNILDLLACENNELFVSYFKENFKKLIAEQPQIFGDGSAKGLPDSYWTNHVATAFVETVRWWISNGRKENSKTLSDYFLRVI